MKTTSNKSILTSACTLAAAACGLAAYAQPPLVQTSTSVGLTKTNWTGTLTVPQFNPASYPGAALLSVTVTLNWAANQAIGVSNNDGTHGTSGNGTEQGVYADEQVSVSALLPNGVTLTGAPPDLIVGAADSDPNSVLVQAPSGSLASAYTLGGLNANASFPASGTPAPPDDTATPYVISIATSGASVSATYTDNATLAAYIGTGNVSFTAHGNGAGNQTDSGGNTSWYIETMAGAYMTVTYTYGSTGNTTSPYTTFTQGGWGTVPHGQNPGYYLTKYFPTACPSGIIIGDLTKNYYLFTSAAAIEAFLPQGGGPALLPTGHKTNPTGKGSEMYGQLLSVNLALAFSNAGVFHSGLGSLVVQSGPFKGYTVNGVAALANGVLGGTKSLPPGIAIGDLDTCLDNINSAYDNGTSNTGFIK